MTFVNLTEIYESEDVTNSSRAHFSLREIAINVNHIVSVREDSKIKKKMNSYNLWPKDLDTRNEFAKLSINSAGSQTSNFVTVIGTTSSVLEKIHK